MALRATPGSVRRPATIAFAALILFASGVGAQSYTLVGWNNLGMHCMDADFSVFSLLPPYNTIHCQLIDAQGNLVTDPAGITVTYEAVADATGSIDTTSAGKTNFWSYVQQLFGVSLPADTGLTGLTMPGPANQPRQMSYDAAAGWFVAEGIPMTPYDDTHRKNSYPLLRLVARNSSGVVLASTDIVVPVSDEMDCVTCHSSGSPSAAEPAGGWVYDSDPQRDFRLNVLRRHDDRRAADPAFQAAASAVGYNPAGLYFTATDATHPKSILCAACHASAALGTSGQPGTLPLTQAVHGMHANIQDPVTGLLLDSANNRSACYRCHPGAVTRCLRGVMGASVAVDGSLAIQCQGCHGSMSAVAAPTRSGWLNEPLCQSCHTGTAVSNSGQLRYDSVFDAPGHTRVAADSTFATSPDVPAPGLSLYRFSKGHGNVACEACHGSTHAEFPSTELNDNVASIGIQGHEGVLAECNSCHLGQPGTLNGGPHGLHPIGQSWVTDHHDWIGEEGPTLECRNCHGADYRGTVLSRVKADRLITTPFGSKYFWRGFQVGCYACHLGPDSSSGNPNHPAVVSNASATTISNRPVSIRLAATDADQDPLQLRIVGQPQHGTAGLSGTLADYFPEEGFSGTDQFTFAAWDGSTDSNLAIVSIGVTALPTATATNSPRPTATPTPSPTPVRPTLTPGAGTCALSGTIHYYSNAAPVNAANVQVRGFANFDVQTDSLGAYGYAGMAEGSYAIQPSKVNDVGAAITALDAVYVLQSVVGLRPLTAEQRFASDVSGNGALSAIDASLILQRVVGLISSFPVAQTCASDWLFIPTAAVEPNQQCTSPVISAGSCQKGSINFQPLNVQATNQDFAAVMFGDATGNWEPHSLVARAVHRTTALAVGNPRRRGRSIYVPLILPARSGPGLRAEFAYDSTQLTFRGIRHSSAQGSTLLAAAEPQPGRLVIAAASTTSLSGNVATLRFDAASAHLIHPRVRIVSLTQGE